MGLSEKWKALFFFVVHCFNGLPGSKELLPPVVNGIILEEVKEELAHIKTMTETWGSGSGREREWG